MSSLGSFGLSAEQSAPGSPSAVPEAAPGTAGGGFGATERHPDVSFVAPGAPLVVVYLAAKLAAELNGSAQRERAQTGQLRKDLLHHLRHLPGLTSERFEAIKSNLDKALKGGATAVAGFVGWLQRELNGPAQRPQHFATKLRAAGESNQAVVQQMRAAQNAWNVSQKVVAQFYWQAAGGQAAIPRLHGMLGPLQNSIGGLRAAYAQSNDPLARLKSTLGELKTIEQDASQNGLAPQTQRALSQVGKWAQSAEQWRARLNEQIHALEQWAREARAAATAQGGVIGGTLPSPHRGAEASVVGAAAAADRALSRQSVPARETLRRSPVALPERGRSPADMPRFTAPGAPGASVEHSSGDGAQVGDRAGEVATRAIEEEATRLENLAQQAYRKLRQGINLEGWEQYLSRLAEEHGVPLAKLRNAVNSVNYGKTDASGARASAAEGGLVGPASTSRKISEALEPKSSRISQLLACLPDLPEDLSVSPQDAEKMKLFVLRLLFNAFENKWQMGFNQRLDVAYDASPDRWWIEFFTRNLPQSQQLVADVLKFFPADVFSNLYRNLETYLSANENNPSSKVALATWGDQTSRAALLRGLGPEKYEAYGDGLRLILSQQIVDGLLVNNPSIEERIKNSELFSRISFWTKDAILNYPLFRGDSPLKPKAMLRMLTDGRVDDYFQEFGWFLQALAAGSINAKRDTKTQANLSDSGIDKAITPSNPWSEPTIDRAFHQEIWRSIDEWVEEFGGLPQVGEARPRDRSPGQFESLDHAGRQRLVAFILRRIAAADTPPAIAPGRP